MARTFHMLWVAMATTALIGACESGAGGEGAAAADDDGAGPPLEDPGCEGPLGPPRDPSRLPECCPEYGEAHCVESIPPELEGSASACDGGGYCVPDAFIRTGGVHTPAACTSVAGAVGVCLSACIPLVAENAPLLPQDVCGESERCVPCINPFDDTDTGACQLGFSCDGGSTSSGGPAPPPCDDPNTCEYDIDTTCAGKPAVDPSSFPACPSELCGSGGHCVPSSLLPADQVDLLADCDAATKCVPDRLIETNGQFLPAACSSVGGFEGRCMSTCLPDVAAQAQLLPQDVCLDGEKCTPCFDPFDGTDTGACTLSCDAGPVEPPKTFAACCEGKGEGTCLPIDLVGASAAEQLATEECQEDLMQPGSVCVPNVIYAAHAQGELFVPTECTTGFFAQLLGASEEGACLPKCIPEVDSAPVGQRSCDDGYKCVPCDQNGESTGACDPQ